MLNEFKTLEYLTIFEPAEEGGYNVSFPDFPGCVTFGNTFKEAKEKAQEVLELWLEEFIFQSKNIPSYTDFPVIDKVKVKVPNKLHYASCKC